MRTWSNCDFKGNVNAVYGSYERFLFRSPRMQWTLIEPPATLWLNKKSTLFVFFSFLFCFEESALFLQSVFTKMTSVINTGEALGISNERVGSVFLARFLETLVCWLDEDKFWSLIEDGPQRLGPNGLQQVRMFHPSLNQIFWEKLWRLL